MNRVGVERVRLWFVSADAAALAGAAAAILLSGSAYLLARQPGVLGRRMTFHRAFQVNRA